MKLNKIMLMCLTAGLVVSVALSASVFAGVEPGTGTDPYRIVGPTMWAVVVVQDGVGATMRIKSIEGCNITTQVLDQTNLVDTTVSLFQTDPNMYLNVRFESGAIPGLACPAIITKVKNFVNDGTYVSFDCQLMFLTIDPDATVCP